jgi:hypothetical protein
VAGTNVILFLSFFLLTRHCAGWRTPKSEVVRKKRVIGGESELGGSSSPAQAFIPERPSELYAVINWLWILDVG